MVMTLEFSVHLLAWTSGVVWLPFGIRFSYCSSFAMCSGDLSNDTTSL